MPKKVEKITITPIMNAHRVVGIALNGVIPFSEFTEDREGRDWQLPLRARGNAETGELAGQVVEGAWVMPADYKTNDEYELLSDGEDKPLYVCKDGSCTANPYIDGTRQPAPFVVLEDRKATNHRDFSTTVTPEFAWDDGKIRKLRISIKANNPLAKAQYEQQKQEKTQRLQASVLKSAKDPAAVDALIDKLIAQKKALMAQQGQAQ